jgi:hypothetical protein
VYQSFGSAHSEMTQTSSAIIKPAMEYAKLYMSMRVGKTPAIRHARAWLIRQGTGSGPEASLMP